MSVGVDDLPADWLCCHRSMRGGRCPAAPGANEMARTSPTADPPGTGGYQFVAEDGRVPAGLIYSTVVPVGTCPAWQDCTNGRL